MAAQSRWFLVVASVGVLPDRGACAFCGGWFSAITHSKTGFGPITAQSSTVAAHHEPGEMDGAKEFNRG